jgi:hypothetical protein
MARIRSIKPEFFTSEQVAECSTTARLLFVGMWCFCDDQGIHPASIARLKMEVFPADPLTKEQIAGLVEELIHAGLLREYVVSAEKYWLVTGWKHQKIEKPSNKYPRPLADHSANGCRMVGDRSPPEGKGEESKGEDQEQEQTPIPPSGGQLIGQKPAKRVRKTPEGMTYDQFVLACKADDEKLIPPDHSVFEFAKDTGIPIDYLELAWREFARQYRHTKKTQTGKRGWRQKFENCIRRNWFKLWWFPSENQCDLTTAGVQLKRERDAA